MSGHGSSMRLPRSRSNMEKAIAAAIENRRDLRQTSVTAMMELAGEDLSTLLEASLNPKEETVASKLKASLPRTTDPLELSRHFNAHFKPLLNVRECIDFDEDARDPIIGGNLPTIINVLINSLRRLKAMPQIRILTALKHFYRAVSTMSRLIRRRNSRRHAMLLEVVNWWEEQEAQFRTQLETDMQSPLFRFHHELAQVIEMKQNLTIPPEVKFGIVSMLYFRQRMHGVRLWKAWVDEVRAVMLGLSEFKRGAERSSSGRYMEPTESRVRALRRKYFDICTKGPQETVFNHESISYEKLMDVKAELARLKSVENRKRLLRDFEQAIEASKDKRRQAYVAMESRREEFHRKQVAARRQRMQSFEAVQRQRHEVMTRKHRRSSSIVTMVVGDGADDIDDGRHQERNRSTYSEGGVTPRSQLTTASAMGSDEDGGPFRALSSIGGAATPRQQGSGPPSRARSRATSVASFVSVDNDSNDAIFDFEDATVRRPSVVVLHRAGHYASKDYQDGSNSGGSLPMEGSVSWGSERGQLRRLSSVGRLPSGKLLLNSGSSTLRIETLANEIPENPLAFLDKFYNKLEDEAARKEQERQFRAALDASGLDEDRKLVQQVLYHKRMTPSPALPPFFCSRAVSPQPHGTAENADATTNAMTLSILSVREGSQNGGGAANVDSGHAEGGLGWKDRADDNALRVHVPVPSLVHVRPHTDVARRGIKHSNKQGASAGRRRTPFISPAERSGLTATSMLRPMSPALSAAVNPWRTATTPDGVEWVTSKDKASPVGNAEKDACDGRGGGRARTPAVGARASRLSPVPSAAASPSSSMQPSSQLSSWQHKILHGRPEPLPSSDHHSGNATAPTVVSTVASPPFQLAEAMLRDGSLSFAAGQERNPVRRMLQSLPMDATAAREVLRRQRDHHVDVKPPLCGVSAKGGCVGSDRGRDECGGGAPRSAAPTTSLASHRTAGASQLAALRNGGEYQQQHASFLAGSAATAAAYKHQLNSMMALTGV